MGSCTLNNNREYDALLRSSKYRFSSTQLTFALKKDTSDVVVAELSTDKDDDVFYDGGEGHIDRDYFISEALFVCKSREIRLYLLRFCVEEKGFSFYNF